MVIGLCGRMGTGKSEALKIFASFGLNVIDCDDVSRIVCSPGKPCLSELCVAFGTDILFPDGTLNRAALAAKCFSSAEKTRALNAITHRHIIDYIRAWVKGCNGDCVVAAPLLFESGFDRECDITLALTAPLAVLLQRMSGRYTEEDFRSRVKKQYTDDFLIKNCDYVIENGNTVDELRAKIELFLQCMGKYGNI